MPRPSEPAGAAGGQGGRDDGGKKGRSDAVGRSGAVRAQGDKSGGQGTGHHGGDARPCPICGKPAQAGTRPFCSKRCRDVDLNRWLSGSYVVPGAESDDEGSE